MTAGARERARLDSGRSATGGGETWCNLSGGVAETSSIEAKPPCAGPSEQAPLRVQNTPRLHSFSNFGSKGSIAWTII